MINISYISSRYKILIYDYDIIKSVQKFPPFCYNFLIIIKKKYILIQYKLTVFLFFFNISTICPFPTTGSEAFIDIKIIIFKSFKPICTRSNGYNIFIVCFTNNSVCISNSFLLMNMFFIWLYF